MAVKSTDNGVSNFSCDSHLLSQTSFKILLILMLLLSHLFCYGKSSSKSFFGLCCLGLPVVSVTFSLGSGDSSSAGLCVVVLLIFNSVELCLKLALLGNCFF